MIRHVDHYEAGREKRTEYFVQYAFEDSKKRAGTWFDFDEDAENASFSTFAKAKKALKKARVGCDTDVVWRIVMVDSDVTTTIVA